MAKVAEGRWLFSCALTLAGVPVALAASLGPSYNSLGVLPLMVVLALYAIAAELLVYGRRLRAKTRRRLVICQFGLPCFVALVDWVNGGVGWGLVALASPVIIIVLAWVMLRRSRSQQGSARRYVTQSDTHSAHGWPAAAGTRDKTR